MSKQKAKETNKIVRPSVLSPVIDKKFLFKFHLPSFLMDLALITLGYLFNESLFSAEGIYYHLTAWQLGALYCVVALMIPWYLGFLYSWFKGFYSGIYLQFIKYLFFALVGLVLIKLLVITLSFHEEAFKETGIEMYVVYFASFLLVLGPMMWLPGSMSGEERLRAFQFPNDKAQDENSSPTTMAFFLIISSVAFLVAFNLMNEDPGFLWIMAGFIVGPLCAVLLMLIIMGIAIVVKWLNLYKPLVWLMETLAPAALVLLLVFWSGVGLMGLDNNDPSNFGWRLLGSLFLTGLVPFRLVMMFKPPLNIIQIVLGVISMLVFLIRIFS